MAASLLMLSTSSLIEASAATRTDPTVIVRAIRQKGGYTNDLQLELNVLLTGRIVHFGLVSPEFA